MSSALYHSDISVHSGQIQELRNKIQDIVEANPDFQEGFYLYFWLKAGKFNPNRAEEIIRENLKWRAQFDIESLSKMDYPPDLYKSFPFHRDGRSRNGMTVWRLNAGKFRFGEGLQKYGKEKVQQYWLQVLAHGEKAFIENTRQLIREGHDPDEICHWPLDEKNWCIINMEGMNYSELFSKKTVTFFVHLIHLTVTYFPFLDGTAVFVNTGKLMEIFFKMARPFLKGSNVDLVVFDSDTDKWKSFLYQHIDPMEIPAIATEYD